MLHVVTEKPFNLSFCSTKGWTKSTKVILTKSRSETDHKANMFRQQQLLYFMKFYETVSHGWQITFQLRGKTPAMCGESVPVKCVLGLIRVKIETHILNNHKYQTKPKSAKSARNHACHGGRKYPRRSVK